MHTQRRFVLFIFTISNTGVWTNIIQLTPAQLNVIENSSSILTCSKTNAVLIESRWENSQITGVANVYNLNNRCITTRFLNDSDLFSGVCSSNGTYAVILKRIDRSQHGAEWICSETFNQRSNKVVIQVSVPATNVILNHTSDGYMKENITEKITCKTSASRPAPRIQWYLRNSKIEVVDNLTLFSSTTYVGAKYDLMAAESILEFRPNRTVNNLRLYCEVWTGMNNADITSREVFLNISYPPTQYPMIHDFDISKALRVIESDTGMFICSVTGGNPLPSLDWDCFGSKDTTSSTQDKTVTSTVKWMAVRNYSVCSCMSHQMNNWRRTTPIDIDVQYPPSKPYLRIKQTTVFGNVSVIKNNTLLMECNSNSNPLPNYTWTGPGMSKKGDTLVIVSVQKSDQGYYECKASNRMTRTNNSYKDGRHSSSVNLIILYPASDPKFRFENSSGQLIQSNIVYVVRNDTFSIYCDVNGNPDPNIIWDDNKNNPSLSISNIQLDKNSTCRATNVMKETASQNEINSKSEASLSIIVFYPPSLPTIHVSNYTGDNVQVQNEIVSIIESETINVTCFSKSKPLPTYKWINEQSFKTQSTNILKFLNISRHESGTYVCNVENIMERSIGRIQVGKSNSKIILNILYPAIVNAIYDISVVEGSSFEILCPIVYGNPSNSTIAWSRFNDKNRWNNIQLSFKNVSREDDGNYTCSVITEMHPTIGSSSEIERRKYFHLNVFFPSEIKQFTISTVGSGRTFVVNENQNLPFECFAEANPTSDLKIMSPMGDYIIEVSQSNIARHILRNASFQDAGEYICSGRNNYTRGTPSQKKLILIVKSRPRPSSGDTSAMKVATVLNVDVTLLFKAWNYLDEPNKTMFSWFKENVSIPNNDNKYTVHSNDLQTNITIRNTTQQDLGFYKVNVENSAGVYTHYYELKATDKPERPRDFRVINDSVTDTSVTLAWSPGFNGGFQQTFVIIYKMMQEHVWLNKSIKDNGDIFMIYTLNDLSSLQVYAIEMFAKNMEGNSFHTERLHFKTKASHKKTKEAMQSSNTGAFVGVGVGASVITLAVVAVSFFGYKRFKNIKSSSHGSPKPGVTAGSHASSTYMDLETSRRDINDYDDFNVQYEHLNTSSREPNTYMELHNTTVPITETSDYATRTSHFSTCSRSGSDSEFFP
ncbi:hemicentin-1-like [Ruditapes philippinarum]|uniref:hemicentin-1-like n=1 Tax=Ruditapes philippinarum TaxID=129788 RepID=UPI00295C06ED|nr:hemicentin-1-like [Ruditapes philippinarum]